MSKPPQASNSDALGTAIERACFLEWRLEQLEHLLQSERDTSRAQRIELAKAAGREAESAGRVFELEQRLAEARQEVATLSERHAVADAERLNLERSLAQAGSGLSVKTLRTALLQEKQRADIKSRALETARIRIHALERARERFFYKLVQWQRLIENNERDNIDLAEFIAELRGEIMQLASENEKAEARALDLSKAMLADAQQMQQEPDTPDSSNITSDELEEDEEVLESPVSCELQLNKITNSDYKSVSFEEAEKSLSELQPDTRRMQAVTRLRALQKAKSDNCIRLASDLIRIANTAATPAIVATIAHQDCPKLISQLVRLLSRVPTDLAQWVSKRLLTHKEAIVRSSALETCLRLAGGDASDIRRLLESGLEDTDSGVRRQTLLVARTLPDYEFGPLLIRGSQDPCPEIRRLAVALTDGRSSQAATYVLLEALNDKASSVRMAAARALRSSLGPDVSDLLNRSDDERSKYVQQMKSTLLNPQLAKNTKSDSLLAG